MIAIIGAGRRAKIFANAISKDIKFVVCSKTKQSADNFAKEFNVEAQTIENIFLDRSITSVIIATPINSLNDLLKKSIDAGKNVFIEKPGCTSSTLCEQLDKIATSKNIVARVGYSWNDEAWSDTFPTHWDNLHINWVKKTSASEDIMLNLMSHPVSWTLLRAKSSIKSVEFLNIDYLTNVCRIKFDDEKFATINVSVSERLVDSRFISMTYKNINFSMSEGFKKLSIADGIPTSAEKQISSFINDVLQCKIKGERDLAHATLVLKTLGR